MKTQCLSRILAIVALSLGGASLAHAQNGCNTGWELMAQQSEGYEIKGCADGSAGRQLVELASWGRIVYARSDAGQQELVCDNNGDEPVRLVVASAKAGIGHDAADTPCAWDGNLYRCEGEGAPRMFCSTSVAVATSAGTTPTATTSVSTREASGMFPFNYKDDIIYGVEQMQPKVADCRSYIGKSLDNSQDDPENSVALSWVISQAGEINQLELRSEHARPGALMKCLNEQLEGFRFNKHQFALQYWEHRFRL